MHWSSGLGTAESTRADAAAFAPASASSNASLSSVDPAASPSSSSSSCPSGGRWATSVRSYYTPTSALDRTLVFESRFESGNLRAACQVSEFEYDLTLSPDRHTSHHTQWYFFRIGNTRAGVTYKFNFLNFTKANSLYNAGMRPLVYSVTEATQGGGLGGTAPFTDEEVARPFDIHPVDAAAAAAAGIAPPDCAASSSFPKLGRCWHRAGSNIAYYRSAVPRGSSRHAYFYALSFCLRAEHDHDTLYIAHCYPYTYSDWNADLASLEEDPARAQFVRRRTLCKTLAGNEVDELTIADFSVDAAATAPVGHLQPNYPAVSASGQHQWPNYHQEQQPMSQYQQLAPRRPVVLVMARVHPGESNSSWMMRGLLDFLTSPDDPSAAELRRRVVFKLVPMLGVDGVVVGNYRCSLSGADLNRTWREPSQVAHPEIHATKQLVARIVREQGRHLLLAVDLHGHSRKKNIFMYGCPAPPPPPPQQPQQQRTHPSAHHSSSSSVFITAPSGSGSATASPLWSSLHSDLSAPLLSLSAAERSHFNAMSDPAEAAASPSATASSHAPSRRKSSKRSKKRSTGAEHAAALLANLNPNRLCERILPRMLARETTAAAEARAAQQAAEADPSYPSSIVSAAVARAEALGAPGSPHATGFSLRECSFSISPGKESTARAVLFREMGVANSYTLEASFCGGSIGALAGIHFNQRHFQRMGEALGRAVLECVDPVAYDAERAAVQRAGVPLERRSNKKHKGGGKSAAAMDEGGDDSDDSTSSTDVLGPSIPLTATTVRQAPKRKGGKKQKKQQDAPETSTPVLEHPPVIVAPLFQREFAPGASHAPGSALLALAATNGPNATNSTSSFSSAPRPGGGGARLARDKMRVVWAAHQAGSKENEVEAALDALRAAEEAAARATQREDKRRQAKQKKMAAAHYKRQVAAAAAAELATLGGDLAPLRRAHARARSASRAGGAGSCFSESPPAPMRAYQPFPSAYATAVAGSNPLLPPPPPPVGLGVSGYFRPTAAAETASALQHSLAFTAMQQRMASTSTGVRSAKPSTPSLVQANSADPLSTVDSREPTPHQRPPSPPRAPTVRFSHDWQPGRAAAPSAAEPAIRTARPSSAFPYTARRSIISSGATSMSSAAQAPSFASASASVTSALTLSARGGRGLPPRSSSTNTHRRSSSLTSDPLGTTLHSMSVSATRFGEDLLPAPVSVASTFAATSSKQQRTVSAGVRRGSSNAPSASPPLLAFGSNLRSASPPAAPNTSAPGGNHTSTNADLLQLSGLAMGARPTSLEAASAAAAGTAASGPSAQAKPAARRTPGSVARGWHV
jgi:hypothetical protein